MRAESSGVKRWQDEYMKETARGEATLPRIDSSGYPTLLAQVRIEFVR